MATVLLAVAGLLVGVALAARRERAPRAWAGWAVVLACLAAVGAAVVALR